MERNDDVGGGESETETNACHTHSPSIGENEWISSALEPVLCLV